MRQLFVSSIALVSASFVLDTAQAQSAKENAWQGLYGQVGLIGYESYIPSSSTGTTTVGSTVLPTTFSGNNANGLAGNISAGYNFAINDRYLIGVAATLYPGHSPSASTSASNAGGTSTGSYNVANVFSFYITPGYAIDQDKMVYAKVGYTGATMNSSASGNRAGNFDEISTYMSGVVLGLGYKQMITESIFAFGEFNYAIDSPKTINLTTNDGLQVSSTAKAVGYDFILGVGYRF